MLCVITGYEMIGCVAFEMASACDVSMVSPIEAAAIKKYPVGYDLPNIYRHHQRRHHACHLPGAVSVGVSVICDVPSWSCDAPIGWCAPVLSVLMPCWAASASCWPCVVFAEMASGVPHVVLAISCVPAILTIGVCVCICTGAMDTALMTCDSCKDGHGR